MFRRHQSSLFLALALLMWSSNFIIGRALAGAIGPFTLACLRWLIALAVLAPFAWRPLQSAWPLIRGAWPLVMLLAASGIALTNTLLYLALKSTSALNAVVINSATPVLVLLFGALVARSRVGAGQVFGMLLALCGALLIVVRGDAAALARLSFAGGDYLVLAAGACWACYTVSLRYLPAGIPANALMLLLFALGGASLAPFMLAEFARGDAVSGMAAPQWLALAYLGVFPSVLAFILYNRALAVMGSERAAPWLYLMPAFGALMSVMFLGEAVHAYHVAGLAAIFAGIACGNGQPEGLLARLVPVRKIVR
ncbi:DMT family transporter [Crenobacter intestini]|uniref:DMT family transporter n=1 Tax=Crenobacter intestini TaxID=2563443 RepID=A0A4V4N940_9NEIS|nr:DMT family transporter [Crenobacter intestini]TIC86883.1 DMT family transporter [Crenobacter intestini]